MDTLDSIFPAVFFDIDDGLKIDIVTKSINSVDLEFGAKLTAGVRPGPSIADMDSDRSLRRIKGITATIRGFILRKRIRKRIVQTKSVLGAGKGKMSGGGNGSKGGNRSGKRKRAGRWLKIITGTRLDGRNGRENSGSGSGRKSFGGKWGVNF